MNDIISPENIVYKKPTLMNDTPMLYCAGCSHGVVLKLVAEVIEEMGMEEKAVASVLWVAPSLPTDTSTSTGKKQPTAVRQHSPQLSSAFGPTVWCSPIRAMATSPA